MGWDRALPQRGPSGLRRHGLNTRAKRLGLVAGYVAPPEPKPRGAPPRAAPGGGTPWSARSDGLLLHREALRRHRGRVAVHGHRRGLRLLLGRVPPHPQGPLRPVVLGAGPEGGPGPLPTGWRLEAGMSGQRPGVPLGGVRGHRGSPGRPPPVHSGREAQTNGWWERVLRTILEECWKPAFARYLIPKYTGLRLDLYR